MLIISMQDIYWALSNYSLLIASVILFTTSDLDAFLYIIIISETYYGTNIVIGIITRYNIKVLFI